jgi:hypothetical protein
MFAIGPWVFPGPVPMNEALERLHKATERVAGLVKEHEQLRQQSTRTEEELGTQRRANEVLSKRVQELEQENEVLRAEQVRHKDLQPQAKERIDELVSEIDRCLAMINA